MVITNSDNNVIFFFIMKIFIVLTEFPAIDAVRINSRYYNYSD